MGRPVHVIAVPSVLMVSTSINLFTALFNKLAPPKMTKGKPPTVFLTHYIQKLQPKSFFNL